MFERYSRQILFREIGAEGQEKLSSSTVLIVGCGALGAAHAETLARAGVGRLRIVDRDFVEVTNLQRQTLFTEEDADNRTPKAVAARNRLGAVNSSVEVDALVEDVTNSNIERLIDGADVVLDGTDNFQTRYLVNDACIKHSTPWIYGAAVSSYGTTMTVIPGETPCLRCIFPEMPPAGSSPTCDTAGVLQQIISSVSAVQTTEAVKLLIGRRDALHGSLVQMDIWSGDWRRVRLTERDPECEACSKRNFEFLDAERADGSAVLCGRDAVQISPPSSSAPDFAALESRIRPVTEVSRNEYLLRFSVEGKELTLFRDGRAIVRGTDDPVEAKGLYAKYIGS